MNKADLSENQSIISSTIELTVPQMGEGLQEAKITRLIKQPGDDIRQDEVIYEMETDKALMEIESPYAGKLIEWLAGEGDILPIGAPLARIETKASSPKNEVESPPFVESSPFDDNDRKIRAEEEETKIGIRAIPPRVRAYGREHNLSLDVMMEIPRGGSKLTIEDVDHYLNALGKETQGEAKQQIGDNQGNQIMHKVGKDQEYREIPLSQQQQSLNYRFKRSAETLIPATLVSLIDLEKLNQGMRHLLSQEQSFISEFQVFAYSVGRAARHLPKFRSFLANSKTIHEYPHINLGIAVQTENKELVTAVIPKADQQEFGLFIKTMQTQIEQALQGKDQVAGNPPHIILTYMGNNEIIFGAPLLVSPAVAILFLGSVLPYGDRRLAHLSLTFDHRVINGMEASEFLSALAQEIHNLSELSQETQASSQKDQTDLKPPSPYQPPKRTQPREEHNANLTQFKTWLLETLGTLLSVDPQKIDLSEPLGLQGMESIKATKLVGLLEAYFNTKIPVTLLWQCPTYNAMAEYFAQRFYREEPMQPSQKPEENISEIAESLKGLSADDIEKLLSEALRLKG